MVTLVAVGVLLLSAGPSLAIWWLLLHQNAHLLVIGIFAAFTWCLSMMLSGTIWLAIPPLKQTFPWVLFVAVTMQELMRYAMSFIFRYMSRRGQGVEAFLRQGAKNEMLSGISVGVGYSLMSVLIQFFSIVADNFSDDTAIYTDNCPINFFVAAGSFSLAYSLVHIFLGMYVWPAYSAPGGWDRVLLCYFLHLGLAELSLVNRTNNGCAWNLGLTWALTSIITMSIFVLVRKRIRKERESLAVDA